MHSACHQYQYNFGEKESTPISRVQEAALAKKAQNGDHDALSHLPRPEGRSL